MMSEDTRTWYARFAAKEAISSFNAAVGVGLPIAALGTMASARARSRAAEDRLQTDSAYLARPPEEQRRQLAAVRSTQDGHRASDLVTGMALAIPAALLTGAVHSLASKRVVASSKSAQAANAQRPWPFGETTNNLTIRQKLEKSIAALRGSQNTPRPADRPALTPGEWARPKAPATNAVPAVTNSVKRSALSSFPRVYAYLVGLRCGKNASLTIKQPTGLTRKIPSALPKVGLTQARPVTMPPAKLMQKRPSAFNR